MKFWEKNDQTNEKELDARQEPGTEISDDLMAQIAGGCAKSGCHPDHADIRG